MPAFDTTHTLHDRKFSGVDFKVPYVFPEGHALTAGEAAWLNSNLASVVGNAFSGDIRRGLVALNKAKREEFVKGGGKAKDYKEITDPSALGWKMQDEFNAKFKDYVLGESNRGSGGAANDPVSQLVRMFSTMDVKNRLAAKGYKVGPLFKTPSSIGADGTKYASPAEMKAAGVEPKYTSKWEELVQENTNAKGEQFKAQAEAQIAAMGGEVTGGDEDDALLAGLTAPEAPAAAA